jgi:hypothetical protein
LGKGRRILVRELLLWVGLVLGQKAQRMPCPKHATKSMPYSRPRFSAGKKTIKSTVYCTIFPVITLINFLQSTRYY